MEKEQEILARHHVSDGNRTEKSSEEFAHNNRLDVFHSSNAKVKITPTKYGGNTAGFRRQASERGAQRREPIPNLLMKSKNFDLSLREEKSEDLGGKGDRTYAKRKTANPQTLNSSDTLNSAATAEPPVE